MHFIWFQKATWIYLLGVLIHTLQLKAFLNISHLLWTTLQVFLLYLCYICYLGIFKLSAYNTNCTDCLSFQ